MDRLKRHDLVLTVILVAIAIGGCDPNGEYGGEMSRPPEAHIDLSDVTFTEFDEQLRGSLFRYLAGSPRWEVREERGLRYAVRLERVDGEYKTTLNGFYTTDENGALRQTRVLLSFGNPHGFGRDRGNITRVKSGSADVSLIVEGEHPGSPGQSSYTMIDGGHICLEIYDQAPEVERKFTQAAFGEVCAELQDVLKHRDVIARTGILPVAVWYPKPLPNKRHMVVRDGRQPGICLVDAAVNPAVEGVAYLKAYDVKTGKRLSAEQITTSSTRYVGWSDGGREFFSYGSRVTVYEGDWSSAYEARFELWHHSNKGAETQLAETTRVISGWER